MSPHRRLPISARHAFALAFDLAVRRDALHSLVVPVLLWAPWILVPAIVPFVFPSLTQGQLLVVTAVGNLFDFLAFVIITAMLRIRARSVFNTPADTPPAPVAECYAKGLRRLPALYVAEALRNLAFGISASMLFVPFLYLGFKLSLATEVVVLRDTGPLPAFRRSFRLTESRFERWLEMIAMSVFVIVPIWFLVVVGFLTVSASSWYTWFAVGLLLTAVIMPIVQYAWTFFYLRLEEIDLPMAEPRPEEPEVVLPGDGAASWRSSGSHSHLRLVEVRRAPDSEPEDDPPSR